MKQPYWSTTCSFLGRVFHCFGKNTPLVKLMRLIWHSNNCGKSPSISGKIYFSMSSAGLGSDDEVRLVKHLFEVKGYNPLIRPVKNLTDKVVVKFGLAMIQLINVVRDSYSLWVCDYESLGWFVILVEGDYWFTVLPLTIHLILRPLLCHFRFLWPWTLGCCTQQWLKMEQHIGQSSPNEAISYKLQSASHYPAISHLLGVCVAQMHSLGKSRSWLPTALGSCAHVPSPYDLSYWLSIGKHEWG